MTLTAATSIREIRHAHLFCGIGGGAIGFQNAASASAASKAASCAPAASMSIRAQSATSSD